MATDRLSATFSALADPTRRAILARLALGETSVSRARQAVRHQRPGDLQASQGAGERRPDHPQPRGAVAALQDRAGRAARSSTTGSSEYRRLWEQRLDRLEEYLRELQAQGKRTSQSPSRRRRRSVVARSSIDLDRDPKAIIATRELDAPRELVWRGVDRSRSIWRNGGGPTASPPRPAHSICARRHLALRHARAGRPRLREPHYLRRHREAGDGSSTTTAAATTSSRCSFAPR